ncbi:MAG: hypothetical protein CK430_13190, partial [Legionella sp.]
HQGFETALCASSARTDRAIDWSNTYFCSKKSEDTPGSWPKILGVNELLSQGPHLRCNIYTLEAASKPA